MAGAARNIRAQDEQHLRQALRNHAFDMEACAAAHVVRRINDVLDERIAGGQTGEKGGDASLVCRVGEKLPDRERQRLGGERVGAGHLFGRRIAAARFRGDLEHEILAHTGANGRDRSVIVGGLEAVLAGGVADMQMQHRRARGETAFRALRELGGCDREPQVIGAALARTVGRDGDHDRRGCRIGHCGHSRRPRRARRRPPRRGDRTISSISAGVVMNGGASST